MSSPSRHADGAWPRVPHKVTSGIRSLLPISQRSPKEALPPWVIAGPFYMALHVKGQLMGCGYQTLRPISTPSWQITGVYFASGKHRKELSLLHVEMMLRMLRIQQLSLVFMVLVNQSST